MTKKKSPVSLRVNIIFFLVFMLFSLLVLRLGIVQIVHGENYQREIDRKDDITVDNPVPRGRILDRNLNVIVDNKAQNAITYTNEGASQEEMLRVAEALAKLIHQDTSRVRERDKKDFWMIRYPERANQLITKGEQELVKKKKINDKQLYQLKLERINKKELSQLTRNDLEVLAIFRELRNGYKFSPQIVKNEGVSREEFATISEHLPGLPGVNATVDWTRSYQFDQTLKTVLGAVSSSKEGLPAEQIDDYISRGYSRNDRVGKSYLEKQYEDVLHGKKEKVVHVTDKSGNLIDKQVKYKGQRGKDLILSIDMELQKRVEKIIRMNFGELNEVPGPIFLTGHMLY